MTRSKLSASDREELIRLFKETTETITSLANQFQVSVSTARRVLKTQLSAEEYEVIVTNRLEGRQNKRNNSVPKLSRSREESLSENADDIPEDADVSTDKAKIAPPIRRLKRRSRRRSSAEEMGADIDTDIDTDIDVDTDVIEPEVLASPAILESSAELDAPVDPIEPASTPRPRKKKTRDMVEAIAPVSSGMLLEVHPIEVAEFPNQCYLVVDRASELITPPLREFAELGRIPSSEESAKTLPIFENHKIASRFSRRSQRVIKIPNSDILKKTYSLLNAKGVERILFDGQVFALGNNQS